jgi:hypothetical protein
MPGGAVFEMIETGLELNRRIVAIPVKFEQHRGQIRQAGMFVQRAPEFYLGLPQGIGENRNVSRP